MCIAPFVYIFASCAEQPRNGSNVIVVLLHCVRVAQTKLAAVIVATLFCCLCHHPDDGAYNDDTDGDDGGDCKRRIDIN